MSDEHKSGMSEEVREQDRYLPIANISRIMKKSLPQNAKIAKDAKETVQECVSEFISFITSECVDARARRGRRLGGARWHSLCSRRRAVPFVPAGRATSASRRSARRSTAMTCCGPWARWVLTNMSTR